MFRGCRGEKERDEERWQVSQESHVGATSNLRGVASSQRYHSEALAKSRSPWCSRWRRHESSMNGDGAVDQPFPAYVPSHQTLDHPLQRIGE